MAHSLSRLLLPFVPLLVVAGVAPAGAVPLQVQSHDPLDRSCPGCDLRQADFRQAHLIGADFRGSDLRGADLREAQVINAYAPNVKTSGMRYAGASLFGSDLIIGGGD